MGLCSRVTSDDTGTATFAELDASPVFFVKINRKQFNLLGPTYRIVIDGSTGLVPGTHTTFGSRDYILCKLSTKKVKRS